jgi:hypothetical protein
MLGAKVPRNGEPLDSSCHDSQARVCHAASHDTTPRLFLKCIRYSVKTGARSRGFSLAFEVLSAQRAHRRCEGLTVVPLAVSRAALVKVPPEKHSREWLIWKDT